MQLRKTESNTTHLSRFMFSRTRDLNTVLLALVPDSWIFSVNGTKALRILVLRGLGP